MGAEIIGELNPTDPVTDPVSDPVTSQVKSLLNSLSEGPKTSAELRLALNIVHRPTFRENYINPAIRSGFIAFEDGVSPRNPRLRYFITAKGIAVLGQGHGTTDGSPKKNAGEYTEKSTVNEGVLTDSEQKIVTLLRNRLFLTQGDIAWTLKISRTYVTKVMGRLKARGIIRRVGPDKGWHWEVVEKK